MKKLGTHVKVNFGATPFLFDIDGMMAVSTLSAVVFIFTNAKILARKAEDQGRN